MADEQKVEQETNKPKFSEEEMVLFEQSVKEEQAKDIPLVKDVESFDALKEEYSEGATGFQQKIQASFL
jgi:hypothetical protein